MTPIPRKIKHARPKIGMELVAEIKKPAALTIISIKPKDDPAPLFLGGFSGKKFAVRFDSDSVSMVATPISTSELSPIATDELVDEFAMQNI